MTMMDIIDDDGMDVEMPDLTEFDMLVPVEDDDANHDEMTIHEEISTKILEEWRRTASCPLVEDVVDEIMQMDVQLGADLLDDKIFLKDPCLSPTSALDDLAFPSTPLDEKDLTIFSYLADEKDNTPPEKPSIHPDIPTPPPSMPIPGSYSSPTNTISKRAKPVNNKNKATLKPRKQAVPPKSVSNPAVVTPTGKPSVTVKLPAATTSKHQTRPIMTVRPPPRPSTATSFAGSKRPGAMGTSNTHYASPPKKTNTTSKKPSPVKSSSSTTKPTKASSSTSPVPHPRSPSIDEQHHRTWHKLSESMRRSQESRKSLHMKTPKTEKYARSKSVNKVLSSIDRSTRQLQYYWHCASVAPTTMASSSSSADATTTPTTTTSPQQRKK